MEAQTELAFPNPAPSYTDLRDRAPSGETDPLGGVVVHRCHPDGEPEDYFALAFKHTTMKGYTDKQVYLYGEDGERATSMGSSRWNNATANRHVRAGSHEDCAVCQEEVSERQLLQEVVSMATEQVGGEHNVARSGVYDEHAVVYLDSHGMGTENGPYDVDNSTQHWDERIEAHPYVYMKRCSEITNGVNWSEPDDTLQVELRTYYPNSGPEPLV